MKGESWWLKAGIGLRDQAAVARTSGVAALELPPSVMMTVVQWWGRGGWPIRRDGDGWRMDGVLLSVRFVDVRPRSLRMIVRFAAAGVPETAWPVVCDRRIKMDPCNMAREIDGADLAGLVALPEVDVAEALGGRMPEGPVNAVAARQLVIDFCDRHTTGRTPMFAREAWRRQRDMISALDQGHWIRVFRDHRSHRHPGAAEADDDEG